MGGVAELHIVVVLFVQAKRSAQMVKPKFSFSWSSTPARAPHSTFPTRAARSKTEMLPRNCCSSFCPSLRRRPTRSWRRKTGEAVLHILRGWLGQQQTSIQCILVYRCDQNLIWVAVAKYQWATLQHGVICSFTLVYLMSSCIHWCGTYTSHCWTELGTNKSTPIPRVSRVKWNLNFTCIYRSFK